jgi:predicted metal-dependent phosphoesterase TrpH
MPRRQPFTALCRAAAQPRSAGRADLHVHTTYSDGSYTPGEVVDLARRAGLAALAVTDHDTLDGIPAAQAAAEGSALEIVPGVEISAEYQGRELHLLAYFVDAGNGPLQAALARLREHRALRYHDMVDRLRGCGVVLSDEEVRAQAATGSLGRRHLASLLVQTRRVGSIREAFQRYLGDQGRATVPKVRLPVAEAIALVRGAGGVAAWAHPGAICTWETLMELRVLGLGAVEVEYPACRPSRRRELRALAGALGLAVTGGSDCHGPGDDRRDVGMCGVSDADLTALRGQVCETVVGNLVRGSGFV